MNGRPMNGQPTNIDLTAICRTYENDGVVRVGALFDARQMAELRRHLDRYVSEVVPRLPGGDVTFEADGTSVRNLWRMNEHDAYFARLATQPSLLALVSRMVHGEPVLLGVETFSKPARVGSGVPAHQDNAYFCQQPADALTVWISIDPVTQANGPVTYYKGSHQLGTLPHRPSGVAGNSMQLAQAAPAAQTYVGTLEPGDALIHHCQTVHESAPNHSDRSRCGLLMVYRGAHTQTDPALKARYAWTPGT